MSPRLKILGFLLLVGVFIGPGCAKTFRAHADAGDDEEGEDPIDADQGDGEEVDAMECTGMPPAGCHPTDAGMCDPVCNTGCTCPQRCEPTTEGVACTSAGPDPTTRACATTSECQGRNLCYQGFCRQLCYADSDCGAMTGLCCNYSVANPKVKICNNSNNCNPFALTGCAPEKACYFVPCSALTNNSDCLTEIGTVQTGMACRATNECAPGNVCVPSTSSSTFCRKICHIGKPDCGAKTCTALTIPGGGTSTDYGYCPP